MNKSFSFTTNKVFWTTTQAMIPERIYTIMLSEQIHFHCPLTPFSTELYHFVSSSSFLLALPQELLLITLVGQSEDPLSHSETVMLIS